VDKLLSTGQVGQALGRSTDWVRRQINDGVFPFVRDGDQGRLMVRERDVQTWINDRVQQRTAAASEASGNWAVNEIARRRREKRRGQQSA
jgi:predicted DNA-binding transcriptional regulator AlpA